MHRRTKVGLTHQTNVSENLFLIKMIRFMFDARKPISRQAHATATAAHTLHTYAHTLNTHTRYIRTHATATAAHEILFAVVDAESPGATFLTKAPVFGDKCVLEKPCTWLRGQTR